MALVRVNAQASVWWREDIAAVARVGPDAILVPKISDADALATKATADRVAELSGQLAAAAPEVPAEPDLLAAPWV